MRYEYCTLILSCGTYLCIVSLFCSSVQCPYTSLILDHLIPAAMNIISVVDHLDRAYLRGSPIGLGVLGAWSAYYVAFSYGAGVTYLLLGREKATQLFGNAANHPVLILVGIPLIPVLLVSLEAYDLEGR